VKDFLSHVCDNGYIRELQYFCCT